MGIWHDSSVGDTSMKLGTDDLHMTLIDNQPPATQNFYIFKMAARFQNGCNWFWTISLWWGCKSLISPSFWYNIIFWRYFYQVSSKITLGSNMAAYFPIWLPIICGNVHLLLSNPPLVIQAWNLAQITFIPPWLIINLGPCSIPPFFKMAAIQKLIPGCNTTLCWLIHWSIY